MTGVDNRIVSIQFDNVSFQKRMAETIASLEKLNQTLKLTGAKQGLSDVSSAANSVKLDGLGDAVTGVSAKFLALSTIAITALSRITTKAIDTGVSIFKALSIEPILVGFREYETNMNSIQTIMANTASKGSTIRDVNNILDEMNTYSDKTIYNFSQMARNVGTFTAAGVKLDIASKSIKGIANLAAVSGSSAEQAAVAMYQLSQAIAAGSVKLIDWNSVVNAGMGGEVFKTALFETGKAMGTLTGVPVGQTFNQWEAAGNSFRESLSNGWITADVLTITLAAMTGEMSTADLAAKGFTDNQIVKIQEFARMATAAAQDIKTGSQLFSVAKEAVASGWSKTFRIIVGDFLEAKALLTGIGGGFQDWVGGLADARNHMLEEWKWFGGRNELLVGLANGFKGLINIFNPLKEAFREVFPKQTSVSLFNLSQSFRELMEKFQNGTKNLEDLKTIFTGVFSIIKIGIAVIKGIVGVLFSFGSAAGTSSGGLVDFIVAIAEFATKVQVALTSGGKLTEFFDALRPKLSAVVGFIAASASEIAIFLEGIFRKLAPVGQITQDKLTAIGQIIWDFVQKLEPLDSSVLQLFRSLGESINDFIDNLFGGGKGDESEKKAEKFGKGVENISNSMESLSDSSKKASDSLAPLKNFFETVGDYMSAAGEKLKTFFSNFTEGLKNAFTDDAFKPALDSVKVGFFGVLALAIRRFSKEGFKFDFGQGKMLKAIENSFGQLTSTLKTMQQSIKVNMIMKLAIAIAILTASMISLAFVDSGALARSFGVISSSLAMLVGSMKLLNSMAEGPEQIAKLHAMASSVVALGIALGLMSFALKNISGLNMNELAKGLFGISIMMALIVAAVYPLAKMEQKGEFNGLASVGLKVIGLAAGLWAMSFAVKAFGSIPIEQLRQGLISVGLLIAGLTVSLSFMPSGDMLKVGAGFLLFAFGLGKLSKVVAKFGEMGWQTIGVGLIGLGLTLAIVTKAIKSLPENMDKIGINMLMFSAAIWVIVKAMETLAKLNTGDFIQGIIGMVLILDMAVSAALLMEEALPGAQAMIVFAAAMVVMAAAVKFMGELDIGTIIKGILGLSAIIVILVLLSSAMGSIPGLTASFEAFGLALALIGLSLFLFGTGAFMAAQALVVLGYASEASVNAFVNILNVIIHAIPGFIASFVTGLIEGFDQVLRAVPKLTEGFGIALDAILGLITSKTPAIITTVGVLVSGILLIIRQKVPELIETGWFLLLSFVQAIRDNFPVLVAMAGDLILNFINGIRAKLPDIILSATLLITEFINGIAFMAGSIITAGTNLIIALVLGISNSIGKIIDIAGGAMLAFIAGIGAKGLMIIAAGKDVIVALMAGAATAGADIIKGATDAMSDFLDACADAVIHFTDKLLKILTKLLEGLAKAIDDNSGEVNKAAAHLIRAIIDGLLGLPMAAFDRLKQLATTLAKKILGPFEFLLKINSPSKVFMGYAYNILEGLTIPLQKDRTLVPLSKSLATRMFDGFESGMRSVPQMLEGLDEFNPTITPVLDLTNAQKDAAALGQMLQSAPISAQLSYSQASAISLITNEDKSSPSPYSTPAPTAVTFEQNIYAPTELSTSDIYRSTRSQIILAKKELNIP